MCNLEVKNPFTYKICNAGILSFQIARQTVAPVIYFLDDLQNLFARLLAHIAVAVDNARHGHRRDADGCGNVAERRWFFPLKVPWEKNKQWMELLAKSGTPLFISAQPEAVGAAQKETIKECFKLAASNLPVGEALDWLENPTPATWKLNGKIERFEWD